MPRIERCCLTALLILYAAPIAAMCVWAVPQQSARTIAALLLAAGIVAWVAAAVARTWRRFFLYQFPLSVLGLGFVSYTIVFNMPPGRVLALVLAGASKEEITGFVGLHAAWLPLLVVLLCAGYLALVLSMRSRAIYSGRAIPIFRVLLLLCVPVTGYVASDSAQMIDGMALDPVVGSIMFVGGDIPRAKAELQGSRVSKVLYHAQRLGGEEVHILVVGESVRRASWSAYGYARPTTPFMDTLKNGDETIFLTNAMADANLTDWSVPIILTGIRPEEFSIGKITGNFLDLARESGYRTAWLVNQDIGISTSIGIDADRFDYPPDLGRTNINGRRTFDEVLLPAFRSEMTRSRGARFIGIHMMGSHWEYFRRYPAQFQRFGSPKDLGSLSMASVLWGGKEAEAAVLDSYDNAVLYTDWFLEQLIEKARLLDVPATLTFFPDHGEDLQLLDGFTGHGGPYYTTHQFKIPAFVWFNHAYVKAHPQVIAALRQNAAKMIRSHNVFFTLAEIMGIAWPHSSPENSFVSANFAPDMTSKFVAGGRLVARPAQDVMDPDFR